MTLLQLTEKVFTATSFRWIPEMLKAGIRDKGTLWLFFFVYIVKKNAFKRFPVHRWSSSPGNPLTLPVVVNVCDVAACCSSRGLMFALAC